MKKSFAAGWNENVSAICDKFAPLQLFFCSVSTSKFAFRASEMSKMAQKSKPLQHENDIEFYMFHLDSIMKWKIPS